MRILALETSAKAVSAAVTEDGKVLCSGYQDTGLTHSRTLMPIVEAMLKNTGLTVQDCDAVAVAAGPGSFTGIRIGVAAAKGLAVAAEKPVAAVSTLEAMAWHGLSAGGYICPVMDARRSQVYNALFKIEGGRPVRLCADRAVALPLLAGELEKLNAPVFLVGDGAKLTASFLEEQGLPYVLAPENLRWQSAWGVAMAAMDKKPGDAHQLLPVYLRLSQAERERQERMAAAEKEQ